MSVVSAVDHLARLLYFLNMNICAHVVPECINVMECSINFRHPLLKISDFILHLSF